MSREDCLPIGHLADFLGDNEKDEYNLWVPGCSVHLEESANVVVVLQQKGTARVDYFWVLVERDNNIHCSLRILNAEQSRALLFKAKIRVNMGRFISRVRTLVASLLERNNCFLEETGIDGHGLLRVAWSTSYENLAADLRDEILDLFAHAN